MVKLIWICIVCIGFAIAGAIISNSYTKWQESPIATTISARPISDLDFPVVTVCPPKGSNTALNYDLLKAENYTLSKEVEESIRDTAFQVFIETNHKDIANRTLASADLQMIAEGSQSAPVPYGKHGFETLQWRNNGTIKTPFFGENFKKAYYMEDKYHHRILDFPDDIKTQIGNGTLVIELEIDTRLEEGWDEWVGYKEGTKYKLNPELMTMYDAERRCATEGGHLASILSPWENMQAAHFSKGKPWIGGERIHEGVWRWTDGSSWNFNRMNHFEDNDFKQCVHLTFGYNWRQWMCDALAPSLCQESITRMRGKQRLEMEYTQDQLTFPYFQVWHSYRATGKTLLDSWDKSRMMTGFSLSWKIKNTDSSLEDVSETLSEESTREVSSKNKGHVLPPPLIIRAPGLQDKSLSNGIQLARQMRLGNMTREQILMKVLRYKILNTTFLNEVGCPISIQKYGIQMAIFRDLKEETSVGVTIDEDIENGILINAIIDFCSATSRNLYIMFDRLVSENNSKELLQTTLNTILYTGMEQSSRKELHEFYIALDKTFGLQFGKILLAISTDEELRNMVDLELPFFANHTKALDMCLGGRECLEVRKVIQTLGKNIVKFNGINAQYSFMPCQTSLMQRLM